MFLVIPSFRAASLSFWIVNWDCWNHLRSPHPSKWPSSLEWLLIHSAFSHCAGLTGQDSYQNQCQWSSKPQFVRCYIKESSITHIVCIQIFRIFLWKQLILISLLLTLIRLWMVFTDFICCWAGLFNLGFSHVELSAVFISNVPTESASNLPPIFMSIGSKL